MQRPLLVVVILLSACGDDSASNSGGSTVDATSQGDATTVGTTGDNGEASDAAASTSSADDDGTGPAPTGTTGSGTSDTGGSDSTSEAGSSDGPFGLCASATSQDECESIGIESSKEFPQPSCQWRDVYTLQLSGEDCSLVETVPRCLLFYGVLQGCGGVTCAGAEGERYMRELDGTAELFFYPYDDICGPVPHAPPEEPDWTKCDGRGDPLTCDCLCDLVE